MPPQNRVAVDRLLSACARGDRATAQTILHAHPGIVGRLTGHDRRVLVEAAERGHNPSPDWAATVQTLLEAGADPAHTWTGGEFPSKDVAKLLVQHGIDIPGKDPAAMRHTLGLMPDEPTEPTEPTEQTG